MHEHLLGGEPVLDTLLQQPAHLVGVGLGLGCCSRCLMQQLFAPTPPQPKLKPQAQAPSPSPKPKPQP